MTAVLEAKSLYRFYHSDDEEVLALQGVSMTVEPGEMVAVIGPSGSGKSTLLACLAGLDEPDGGTVWVEGVRISRRPDRQRAKMRLRSIGVLYQAGNLVEHLSVRQNVGLALSLAGGGSRRRVDEVLDSVGLAERRHARPSQLSGGEAARAGLAVALANRPSLILADEPTGEVDSAIEDRMLGLLRGRTAAGAGVVLVTHSEAVARAADRRVELVDGRVVH